MFPRMTDLCVSSVQTTSLGLFRDQRQVWEGIDEGKLFIC